MPGTTTESQKKASHRRYHLNKGVVKSTCPLCLQEHPELGADIHLNPGPTVEIIRGPSGDPIEGARVFVSPVLTAPDPGQLLTDQMERDKLYQWAALNRTIDEVATALGCSPECFTEKIEKLFGVTWEKLSARAFNECSFQVMSNLYARAQGGDARFVLLFSKLVGLPEFHDLSRREIERTAMPISMETRFRNMSTVDLLWRRQELARVIDRKPSFQLGPMGETLSVVPTDLIEPKLDSSSAIKNAKSVEEVVEAPDIETKQEPPAPITSSTTHTQPATWSPASDQQEILRL